MTRLVALAFVLATMVTMTAAAHAAGAGGSAPAGPALQSGHAATPPAAPPSTAAPDHHRPHRVIFVPVFVGPSYSCLSPGYWTYQWIPQIYWYTVWVPGAYTPDWNWIDGHYEQRPYTTGYYQPVWMPARWRC